MWELDSGQILPIFIAFFLGLVVGGVLRVPVRVGLGVLGVVLAVYALWAPSEVMGWVRDWGFWLEREAEGLTRVLQGWVYVVLRNPQEFERFLVAEVVRLGPQVAFWAGVVGRVLA